MKRTIRDYLHNFKNQEIFVREVTYDAEGHVQDGKMRAGNFANDATRILNECIDIRLFGGVIPLKDDSIIYTGPVQFKMGRSLHRVTMMHIKGTGAFASKEGSKQATFREEDFLPYSLISFYGIVNENAAKHTHLTEDDLKLLLEGTWNGTKSLISRSKAGQVPRLLLKVNYSKENYHIGDLDKMLKLVTEMPHENIRDTIDYQLEISELVKKLAAEKGSIKDIEICVDGRIKFCKDGAGFPIEGLAAATGIAIKPIVF